MSEDLLKEREERDEANELVRALEKGAKSKMPEKGGDFFKKCRANKEFMNVACVRLVFNLASARYRYTLPKGNRMEGEEMMCIAQRLGEFLDNLVNF